MPVRFRSPTDSGSIVFRSAAAIGVPPPPVIAPITSPAALPAAALSPDFCASSMRLPASSMRLAISAMAPGLIVTLVPSGALIVTLPGGPPVGRWPCRWRCRPGRRPGPASPAWPTPMMTMLATMPQTITTAV